MMQRPFAVESRPPGWSWKKKCAVFGAVAVLVILTFATTSAPDRTTKDLGGRRG